MNTVDVYLKLVIALITGINRYVELITIFSITVKIALPQGEDNRQNEGMSTRERHQSRH